MCKIKTDLQSPTTPTKANPTNFHCLVEAEAAGSPAAVARAVILATATLADCAAVSMVASLAALQAVRSAVAAMVVGVTAEAATAVEMAVARAVAMAVTSAARSAGANCLPPYWPDWSRHYSG